MFSRDTNIDWYRTPVDRAVLDELMQRSDVRGWIQTLSHLGAWFGTGWLAFIAYSALGVHNWTWCFPLLIIILFVHGTVGPFLGLIAIHELQHRTVFKTRALNEFFELFYAFCSWADFIWYQQSHPLHHKATCHHAHDGEIYLPQKFSLSRWQVWLGLLAWNPLTTVALIRKWWRVAHGHVDGTWAQHVLPADNKKLRLKYRRWAWTLLLGHGSIAAIFVATGNWFLVVVFTIGTQYCSWLGFLCGLPQHYGMQPNVPDFRYSTRTFTCSWLPAFLYWNMQYHVEHHMYPAVPFFNLPKLRKALAHDLPPAPHGLRETWRQMLEIKRKVSADPNYQFVPAVPKQAQTNS